MVWENNYQAFWLAVDDKQIMIAEILDSIGILSDITAEVEVAHIESLKKRRYSDDLGNHDTIKEDLRQAREINMIQITVRNCISCLRKIRMLKVVIKKSINVSGVYLIHRSF
jgi:predicted chitinase